MPDVKLPPGVFTRKDRPGYWTRDRRNRGDRWVMLGHDLRTARAKLKEVRGGEIPGPRLNVKAAAARWVASYVATARRNPRDRALVERRVEQYLVPAMGFRPLSRITAEDCRSYRLGLEQKGLAPQTVAHVLSDLRCLLGWAVEARWIARSPFPRRLLPRIQERPPDRLTDDEVARLLQVPEPWAFYLRLALGTGLRWAELTRAQGSDVVEGVLVVHQTKSGRVRRVPLPPALLAEVRQRVGRLFPYSVRVSGSFNTTIRGLSGVARFHVHQTRHTFACRWIEQGGSLAALQQILGHRSITTTQRYARIGDDLVRAEAKRVQGGIA